jgi:uncharacterized protein (TIGR00730 family)
MLAMRPGHSHLHVMHKLQAIAVFCGSRSGNDPAYRSAAQALGHGLAKSGLRLVYGGGRIGLMGVLADAALAAGGEVLGVIPEFLTRREVAHDGITELVVTASMHSRKQRMFEAADAFVSMPGGTGTLDETIEIITWRQLRLHDKPIVVVDIVGYWQKLQALIDHVIERGFASPRSRGLFQTVDSVDALMTALAAAHEPVLEPEAKLI